MSETLHETRRAVPPAIPFWLLVGLPLAGGAWTTLWQLWRLLQSTR